jgi:hypothetical protein
LLDLGKCPNLTDDGLARIRQLVSLEAIYLNGCVKLTDAGIQHVDDLPKLKCLFLGEGQVPKVGGEQVQGPLNGRTHVLQPTATCEIEYLLQSLCVRSHPPSTRQNSGSC